MIELDPFMVVLMIETTLVLVFILLVIFILSKNRAKGEHSASSLLIDKLQDTENIKSKKTRDMIAGHCHLEPGLLDNLLEEIKSSERHLYQQIIKIFLARDIKELKKIDQHIDKVSEPYCKILAHASGNGNEETQIEEKVQKLKIENERLTEQLTIAMSTMDEISAEYTRVFSGTQTELELENSSKKMFEIFQKASGQVKEITPNQGEG